MICPKCKELGLKSTVTVGWVTCTAMYCPPYYDEEGNYHNHDLNSKSREAHCSNGHKIKAYLSNKCPNCDFGHEETVTVVA